MGRPQEARASTLGDDVWRLVLQKLDEPASVLALSVACKRFRALATDWFALCRAQFQVEALERSSICLCGHHCSGSSSRRCCRCRRESALAASVAQKRRRCFVCAEQYRLERVRPSVQRLFERVAAERRLHWLLERSESEPDAEVSEEWQKALVDRMAARS
ncbi:hypothetical protein KFE25_011522 [Diacronema lutheri]|uniref:F-box domain-containing protein n=1 Tax=Diacronema lutheri TaxID=2081491 RepID=A0A8J5XE46_DIALT|nr:hypothetical protein KFE25_011522 [Diacronema lutheri]